MGPRDARLSFVMPNITCPRKRNLMLDLVSSIKCLIYDGLWDLISIHFPVNAAADTFLVIGQALPCLSKKKLNCL